MVVWSYTTIKNKNGWYVMYRVKVDDQEVLVIGFGITNKNSYFDSWVDLDSFNVIQVGKCIRLYFPNRANIWFLPKTEHNLKIINKYLKIRGNNK